MSSRSCCCECADNTLRYSERRVFWVGVEDETNRVYRKSSGRKRDSCCLFSAVSGIFAYSSETRFSFLAPILGCREIDVSFFASSDLHAKFRPTVLLPIVVNMELLLSHHSQLHKNARHSSQNAKHFSSPRTPSGSFFFPLSSSPDAR